MEAILVDDRLDPGEFGDLMDQGFRVVAGEPMTTTTTGGRFAVDRFVDLLRRGERTVGLAMSRLPAAFLAAGRSGRLALHPDGIGRRRLGRVGGVEFEPVLKVPETGLHLSKSLFRFGKTLFIGLDERKDCRLDFWRSLFPDRFWERGRLCHAGKITASFGNANPRL
jgi:hypothetical protein